MLDSTVFICQLSTDKQKKIQNKVKRYLTKEKYDKKEIHSIIENVMSDRLCVLEEFMSIKEFLS